MKKFKVEITETLQRTIVVKASSREEALNLAKQRYCCEEEVLGSEDYIDTEFEVL